MSGRLGAAVLATAVAALALAAAASADREQVKLTAAGNAAARAAVVVRSDLGGSGWSGGLTAFHPAGPISCGSYRPKQSDLVLVGGADSSWKHSGLVIVSEAQVLQTAQMVQLDWRRSVETPKVLPCLRSLLARQVGSAGTLVSFRRLPFAAITPETARYRAILHVRTSGGTVPLLVDLVLVASGRTELTLLVTAALAAQGPVAAAEVRLARTLAARARP
jgi:hypothetical protein